MKLEDFDYELPERLIAQTPLKDRSSSRMLVLNKNTGVVEHKTFKNMIEYLDKGDTLVLNDTKVIPARLIGEKTDTKAVIEVLLLKILKEIFGKHFVNQQKELNLIQLCLLEMDH